VIRTLSTLIFHVLLHHLDPVEETLFCQRNIDAVLLMPNATDVNMRMEQETPMLPLDGLLSQAGEVFFQVQNLNLHGWTNLTLPYTYIHSPYFTMHMTFPGR
jgi:hypothetical protein